MDRWQFYRHMPVYLAGGRLLGHTVEIGHAVECIHVQQGRVLIRDWYVPISAVRDVTDAGVYLDVRVRDLRRTGWNVPTETYLARQGLVTGYEYTSRADIPDYATSSTAGEKS